MATELPKIYDPHEAQKRWLALWEERGYWHSRPDESRQAYCIVIPPPNVTGALHMGHALNNTLQDVLIRYHRARGFNALWMPGTDHAGIATQAVVEKRLLQEEKKSRHELGREELVRRIWTWKDQYEMRILGQLRELGCSCDWARTRFTLDDICARAVRQTFFNLFRDGLIYRGKRLVNWDAFLQTSVADDEVENVEQEAEFSYFKYPFADGKTQDGLDHVLIATTRPETMLGDTAVAVHPDPRRELDKRAAELNAELAKADEKDKKAIQERLKKLAHRQEEMLPLLEKLAALARAGAMLELPLVGRKIPLIADFYADPEKGTGAVKITPAHDFNDWLVGERHPEIGAPINILHSDGRINENGKGTFRGETFSYVDLDRFEARKRVLADLERLGLLDRVEKITNTIPISDRSKTPIEPYLSDQWFVKMADLAQSAIDAVKTERVKFFPDRYKQTYLEWLGEKRDWCISRQLWWGHRIPIWYARCAEAELKRAFAGRSDVSWRADEENARWMICALNDLDPQAQGLQLLGLVQDPDVLDTWFSSALWPHSTLGWPEQTPELKYYYPTSVLVTSRDIITLWVARMVITGLYNCNNVPFHHVYIHSKILDGFGEGMSKSKGNGVDPLDIIERYGTDALRFVMVHLATETQDSRMPVANVCPHCGTLVPMKKEHMGMRTRKVTCPGDLKNNIKCGKAFRPGGPWPAPDPELPTAKQASEKFEMGRNFANKLWNAARFLLMKLEEYRPEAIRIRELPIEDRWILSRLATITAEVTAALGGYHFSEAARIIYDFTWSEFCDWYVEMSKGRLNDPATRPLAQRMLVGVLDAILRLVQPIMPFVAESIWQHLNESAFERGLPNPEPAAECVVIASWPSFPAAWTDAATERRMERMQDFVRAVRDVRSRYPAVPFVVTASEEIAEDFRSFAPILHQLTGFVSLLEAGPHVNKPAPPAITHVGPEYIASGSLKGIIDLSVESSRIEKQLTEKRKHLQMAQAKLDNEAFRTKANPEVVQQQMQMVAKLQGEIKTLEDTLRDFRQA